MDGVPLVRTTLGTFPSTTVATTGAKAGTIVGGTRPFGTSASTMVARCVKLGDADSVTTAITGITIRLV